MISKISDLNGILINMSWSCNQSPSQMESEDTKNIYFGCTSSSDFGNGTLGVWSLNDILESKD